MINIKTSSLRTINWINKDKKNRKLFLNKEIDKKLLKSLLYNNIDYPFLFKMYFDNKIKKFYYNSSISKLRIYCIFLGNCRSIFHKFKLSRHICKKYGANGYITGLKKSSF